MNVSELIEILSKCQDPANTDVEVMDLAKKYRFITKAFGGTAQLCTHQVIYDYFGADEVAKNMRMNAIELPESWEVENAS